MASVDVLKGKRYKFEYENQPAEDGRGRRLGSSSGDLGPKSVAHECRVMKSPFTSWKLIYCPTWIAWKNKGLTLARLLTLQTLSRVNKLSFNAVILNAQLQLAVAIETCHKTHVKQCGKVPTCYVKPGRR